MQIALAALTLIVLSAAIPVIFRVKRECEGVGVLSDLTVTVVWCQYLAIAAAASLSATFSAWPMQLPRAVEMLLGVSSDAIGVALVLWGLASMASFRRMSGTRPDRLIQGGAFRFSRNPQNVGVALMLVGVSFLLDSGLALVAALGFWAVFYAYLGYEESHLAKVFGVEYERYRRHTPRFFGVPR
ncbi:MAG TPA: methyltransferase [Solirubrobacterales bacterium]|nr:methyltransferase [Solirubrobacterales bacterium]